MDVRVFNLQITITSNRNQTNQRNSFSKIQQTKESITGSWVKSFWEFVNGKMIHINSHKQLIQLRIRIGDQKIIEELINYDFEEADFVGLNRVKKLHKSIIYPFAARLFQVPNRWFGLAVFIV